MGRGGCLDSRERYVCGRKLCHVMLCYTVCNCPNRAWHSTIMPAAWLAAWLAPAMAWSGSPAVARGRGGMIVASAEKPIERHRAVQKSSVLSFLRSCRARHCHRVFRRAPFHREDDNFQAKVFARQDSTVPNWKDIGTIACCNPSRFSAAM